MAKQWKLKSKWYRAASPRVAYDPDAIAEGYARYLAKQQGIDLKGCDGATVNYTWNGLNGTRKGWAESVEFWRRVSGYREVTGWYRGRPSKPKQEWQEWCEVIATITIPHSDFNPAARDLNPHLKPVGLDGEVWDDMPGYEQEGLIAP